MPPRLHAALALVALLLATTRAPADQRITLHNALSREDSRGSVSSDLILDLPANARTLWAYAPTYNRADHPGTVRTDNGKLHITLQIADDGWQAGGPASFTLTLPSGQSPGAFEGTFRNTPVKGTLTVKTRTPWPATVADHTPFAPGEHPRLLLRKTGLDRLKREAQTPEGKKIIERLDAMLQKGHKGFGWYKMREGGAIEAGQGF